MLVVKTPSSSANLGQSCLLSPALFLTSGHCMPVLSGSCDMLNFSQKLFFKLHGYGLMEGVDLPPAARVNGQVASFSLCIFTSMSSCST